MPKFRSQTESQTAPQPNIVHQHTPSRAGELAIQYGFWLMLPVIVWFGGLFLFKQAGFYRPGQALAQFIIIGLVVAVFLWFLSRWFGRLFDRRYEHLEIIEEERTKQAQYRQLMARSITIDTRTLGERERLTEIVTRVMLDAFDIHYQNEGTLPGNARPWSRRAICDLGLGDGTRPSETEAARVKRFLLENEIITGRTDFEQINIDRYPDIATVQRLFNQPAVIRGRPSLPATGQGVNGPTSILE